MWPETHLRFLPETNPFMKKRTPRNQFIKCRVTPADKDYLHELMKKTGHRSEASFIRDAVFKTRPVVIRSGSPTDEEIWQQVTSVTDEINRIGTNYNQIVRKVNMASIEQCVALERSREAFNEIINVVQKAANELRDYLTNPNKRL